MMSEDSRKPIDDKKKPEELSEKDLSKVSGGILNIGGIKGESQDDNHKGSIEI